MIVVAAVLVSLSRPYSGSERVPAISSGEAGEWVPVVDPERMFALAPSTVGVALSTCEARAKPEGDLREDSATFGTFEGQGTFLGLTFTRGIDRGGVRPSYFLALARAASSAGLAVLRVGPKRPLDTKFGLAEVAETLMSGRTTRNCLSFRVGRGSREYGLSGWMCGAGADIDNLSRLDALIEAVKWRDPRDNTPA